jgi:hypothetical protein
MDLMGVFGGVRRWNFHKIMLEIKDFVILRHASLYFMDFSFILSAFIYFPGKRIIKKSRQKEVIKKFLIFFSDPEEGNVIANSHHGKHEGVVGTEIPEPKSPTNEMQPMGEGERSVLQAKLTNMAIQVRNNSFYYRCIILTIDFWKETKFQFLSLFYPKTFVSLI